VPETGFLHFAGRLNYEWRMLNLDDETLTKLLDDVESDRVERKTSWSGSAAKTVPEAICAMANDLPNHRQPGVIFIGATDFGAPSHLQVDDHLLLTLANLKSDGRTVPPPSLLVEKRTLKGADMAVVQIAPADAPPVRFEGRIWIRVGPRRGLATAQDERILNEKRRSQDKTFDTHAVKGSALSDLDVEAFQTHYLPNAVAPDVLEANGRTVLEQLASTGLVNAVEQATPTVTGLLTLGKTPRKFLPGAFIQFLRVNGTEWGDPVSDEQVIDGPFDAMLRKLDEKLKGHLTVAVDFLSGSTVEIRTWNYPLVALQQLCRNAVMHRTYENTNAPVKVYWFDDRIEIISPGGPFGLLNKTNFGQPGLNDYRNPTIAGALKILGYAQQFGFGIAAAQKALKANGNGPVEFEVQENVVKVTVRRG
jgi:ATP-dependent DNA helicase RecG